MVSSDLSLFRARGRSSPIPILEVRRNVSVLTRTEELETFFDLTVLVTEAFASRLIDRREYPDSLALIDVILSWANDFNEAWAWSDWTEDEYRDEIERFFKRKILEVRLASEDTCLPDFQHIQNGS